MPITYLWSFWADATKIAKHEVSSEYDISLLFFAVCETVTMVWPPPYVTDV